MLTRVLFAAVMLLGLSGLVVAQDPAVVALGLTDHKVTENEIAESNAKGEALPAPKFNTPGVAYAWVAHPQEGDTVELHLMKDGTSLMHNLREVAAEESDVLVLAGKTGVPAGGWPSGQYTAKVTIMRDGKTIVTQETDAIPFE